LGLPTSDVVRDRRLVLPFGCPPKFGVDVCGDNVNGKGEGEGEVGEVGEIGDCGTGGIPVTCLQNVAMARKQNFAGVVKEKRTGKTWAASEESGQVHIISKRESA
jgi:hypothetical protein